MVVLLGCGLSLWVVGCRDGGSIYVLMLLLLVVLLMVLLVEAFGGNFAKWIDVVLRVVFLLAMVLVCG